MTLRNYQRDVVYRTEAALEKHDSVMIQAPTGSGKTRIAVELMRDRRSIFLAPRRELVEQAWGALKSNGLDAAVIMADTNAEESFQRDFARHVDYFVASKDTIVARLRQRRFELPEVKRVIVDEAHLSASRSWRRLIAMFRDTGAQIIGLSATPHRKDGASLGAQYGALVTAPSVRQLTHAGYLTPARYYAPSRPVLDDVPVTNGDFERRSIDELYGRPKLVGDVVGHWIEHARDRPTIIFCSGVRHSAAIADELQKHGVEAMHVEGRMAQSKRSEAIARFRERAVDVLTNFDLLTYGLDVPEVSCLSIARPTMSLVLHLQMLGRGLRTAPGKKDLLVLDHAGNVARHGFADDDFTWDLAGGPLDDVGEVHRPAKSPDGERVMLCPSCNCEFRPADECPECSYHFERVGRDIEVVDRRLVLVSQSASGPTVGEARYFYRQLLGLAAERGWKAGRAYHLFRERFGKAPLNAWRNDVPTAAYDEVRRFVRHQDIRWSKRRASS